MKRALYPGTFDPVTNGHLDVIARAAMMFDTLVITIAQNKTKSTLFTPAERKVMVEEAVKNMPNVSVEIFDGMLVDFAVEKGARVLVRGLRAISDFEYEFQMALMNRKYAPDVSTVFLMPHEKYTYLNSTIVRELARLGKDVGEFVPQHVATALKKKFSQ